MHGRKDVMTVTMMTPAQLERFRARLLAERADAEERLVEFDDAMTEVRAAAWVRPPTMSTTPRALR